MDNSNAIQSQLDMARNVHDIGSLNTLRTAAKSNSPEALREAAEQFEAIFVQMLLKSMRKAQDAIADQDSPFNSQQVKFYRDMHDTQLSTDLASGGSLGLADIIVRQLGNQHLLESRQGPRTDGDIASYNRQSSAQTRVAIDNVLDPDVGDKQAQFATPEQFVEHLYPYAQQTANAMGIEPKALIAQAAVETGWGRYMIHKPDGENANNLFGIKADKRWEGDKALVSTLEYDGAVASPQKAQFRAYSSMADSMRDYADFIQQNPRYSSALEQTGDPSAYFNALQEAGYATDPKYAEKVISVLNSNAIQQYRPEDL